MLIREVQLFEGLGWEMMEPLASLAQVENHDKGDVLIHQGREADRLFILDKGTVELRIEGRGALVYLLNKRGELFGWSSLVEEGRYTASAVCTSPTQVITLQGRKMLKVFDEHPKEGLVVYRRLGKIFSQRLLNSYLQLLSETDQDDSPSYG